MTTAPPVRLAGRTLKETRHICAFFHSKQEQNKVLMPFFKEGFERGEKLFHIVDGRHRDAHLCACQDGGIDLETLTSVARQLNEVLDEQDPISGSYTLEVTSPGLERNLRTAEHFAGAIGDVDPDSDTARSRLRRWVRLRAGVATRTLSAMPRHEPG